MLRECRGCVRIKTMTPRSYPLWWMSIYENKCHECSEKNAKALRKKMMWEASGLSFCQGGFRNHAMSNASCMSWDADCIPGKGFVESKTLYLMNNKSIIYLLVMLDVVVGLPYLKNKMGGQLSWMMINEVKKTTQLRQFKHYNPINNWTNCRTWVEIALRTLRMPERCCYNPINN